MRRRDLLTVVTMTCATAVSGCLGGDSDGDSGDDGETDSDDGDDGSDGDGTPATPPEVALSFDVDTEANTLTITHTSGELFTAGQVFVTGDGLEQEGYWHEFSETHGQDDTVAAGASIQVPVSDDFDVEVRWEPENGGDSSPIGTFSS